MTTPLLDKMAQLETKCSMLEKNRKYEECVSIMEELASIKKSVYGINHVQFEQTSEKLCEYLNLLAMIYLQKGLFDESLDLLKKAELVARNSLAMKSTTYNNLACYYRRTGKVRTALTYLIQTLDIQLKLDKPATLADTHLNICAVLSQLNRHEDALQHSMLSIILLQDQFLTLLFPRVRDSELQLSDQRLAVLAIAYHNLGVQFQHLTRFEEALKIYRKALSFSIDNVSNNTDLVRNLERVVKDATQQIDQHRKTFINGINKSTNLRENLQRKNDLYKDLSKRNQRFKALPRLKLNHREHSLLYEERSAYESQGSDHFHQNQQVDDSKQRDFPGKIVRSHRLQKSLITPESRNRGQSSLKTKPNDQ